MAPRRGAPSSNALSPQEPRMPSASSPGTSRSISPSGFTQFLTKPSKWFTRSASTSKLTNNSAITEPRPSGSFSRKHKISRPTDPRPILDGYAAKTTRSVLDLSIQPPGGSHDISPPHTSSTPSSPVQALYVQSGLGDLRNISRKAWSRSADDLNKMSPSFSPIKASFQDKVAEYRSRSDSNASAMTPTTPSFPSAPVNGRHPFPSLRNASPSSSSSSSPPRSATLPSVSVSVSTPGVEEGLQSATHVHTRSRSFTPKLSSKLATPILPRSPKRQGSGASERELEIKESEVSPNSTTRNGAYPRGLISTKPTPDVSTPSTQTLMAHRATTLLAPPIIIEPEPEMSDDTDPKRSSQILYHSGFINRLADVPNHFQHTNLALAKGWKPFKLELKGSKLYFYKPPGDRNAAVKDLFPTEFVPAALEEDEDAADTDCQPAEDGSARVGKGRDDTGTSGRKKRAYWGRRTHPEIVQADGKIAKGTLEALIHETVFATLFLATQDQDQADNQRDPEAAAGQRREDWKDFASSVILCLPSIVGQGKFEPEFLRCCEYLVSGADDNQKAEERLRVGWLAGEYMRYHGMPVDLGAWDEWRQETIPDVSVAPAAPSLPLSASMQAMHPSPMLVGSPNVNTFSPRPNEDPKMVSLLGALNVQDVPPSPSKKASLELRNFEHQQSLRTGARMPWAALEQEGLSRDVLLLLDPALIAHSLSLFHRSVLGQAPEHLTANFVMGSESSTQGVSSFGLLFGSDVQPHWLTKLLLIQILGADTSTGNVQSPQLTSPGRKSEDRSAPQPTSRTHSRSEVISVWTRVGELCRLAGDECSWRAIFAALCSRPVARLEKAWKRVDPLALAAIESWVYPGSDGEVTGVKEPKITPWGRDIRERLKDELTKASGDGGEQHFCVESFEKARVLFEGFRTSFLLCPRRVPAEEEEREDVQRMVAYWQDMAAESGGPGSLAIKFQRMEQFMSLSLAAEPRRKGLFEPFFWSRAPSGQSHPTPLLPLLFPEPLPTVSLIDRNQIIRGRVESDASDIHSLRGMDALQPDRRRPTERPNPNLPSGLVALGQGGTIIPVYNGDLLLVVQSAGSDTNADSRPSSSRGPSRPSSSVDHGMEKGVSRNPSIRVKPGSSHGLDRKTSVARRNSLPSLSQRQNFVLSEPSSEPPLRVVVQAGTLNMLINILVHGLHNVSVSVADDNGEMSLRERPTRGLLVDREEFANVWWNVFRSFVTPVAFFELLRKLYITLQPVGSSPSITEYLYVANARSEALETMKEWLTLGGGASDILDDPQLYSGVRSFLDSPSDHLVYQASNFESPSVRQAWDTLAEAKRSLYSLFTSQAMRPLTARGPPIRRGSVNGAATRTLNLSTREPPDIDRIEPEDFVDNLDGMACAALSNVPDEDLYVTADLLEVQSTDRTGWFSTRDAATVDDVEIQTLYSHIQEVDHSSLISELNQDSLYRLLPPGVRSCVRAYSILRKWIISKIVASRLGLRARQARMEFLLRVIEVTRLRNMESAASSRLHEKPCVRSFVEAVTTSAILSVESRMHHRAWQNVALARGTHSDSLVSLLSRPYMQSASSHVPLTPDMGWLLERILEVVASPDMIESSIQDNQSLVNFNKRRHLHDLINKGLALPGTRRRFQPDDLNRRAFERLNNVEKDVMLLEFDNRGIRDEAVREASQLLGGTPSSTKKASRPFQRLVTAQQEKNRRDKHLRTRLQKEKHQEQLKHDRRDEQLARAMWPRKQGSAAMKQHRNKKSMSAFLHFMRPISSAFGADTTSYSSPSIKRTAAELDFMPAGKPSLVLSLMDARVAQFINNERSFTFQLDTEDGGHYLLQAMNRRDMMKWIETIIKVTNMAAKRRLTYLGNSPKARVSDHIHDPIVVSRDPMAVFGVELEFLLHREANGEPVQPSAIPSIIELCLTEVENRGLSEQGIYRIAGAASEINTLKDAFNRGENPINSSTDIYAVCDLVKTWFRVLPEPVFPSSSYHDVIEAMQLENLDSRLSVLRDVVHGLPSANFDLLRRVSEHLDKVTDFEEYNHMTAEALAIVFSPNLLRAPQNDFVMILANMGHTHKLVKALITHLHVIFDDADPEAGVHSEDDLDSPLLEGVQEEDEASLEEPRTQEHDEPSSEPYDGQYYTPC